MTSIFGKQRNHCYINNLFFFESVMLNTYVHILKSTYLTKYKSHILSTQVYIFFKRHLKWALFRGDGGARMYIESNIKS